MANEAKRRIYMVRDNENPEGVPRLVRAAINRQAVNHVSGTRFTAEVPTQDELFALAAHGVLVEEAGEEVNADGQQQIEGDPQ